MKLFNKKIIISLIVAVSFTTFFKAEVSFVDLKGLSTSLKEEYQKISPALGALYWNAGYIENLYRYGYPQSAAVKLVKQLFYLLQDGLTFDTTRAPGNAGTYLDAHTIGKIVGHIFVYEQEFQKINSNGNGKLKQKQQKEKQAELMAQLRSNIETNVLAPIKAKRKLSTSSMRNLRSPLFNSLSEEIGISDKPLYVSNNTINILLSFLWKKATKNFDFILFLYEFHKAAKINPAQIFKNTSLLYQKYTKDDYTALKNKSYDQIQNLPLEDFVFLFLAEDVYDNPLPAIVSMVGNTQYQGTTFADCGETALRNFFNALLYKPEEKKFDRELLENLKAQKPLIDFYTKYKTQEQINTNQAHDDWANVVSELPGVNYVKTACEINAGISNMLKVINNLIPETETFDKLSDKLKEYGITMEIYPSKPLDDQQYDNRNSIKFEFKKNDKSFSLTWNFQPSHFFVTYPPLKRNIFNNYKKFFSDNLLQENPFKQATYCALLSCFEEKLDDALKEIENKITEHIAIYEYQSLLLQKMKTPEEKIETIEQLQSKKILSTPQLEKQIEVFLSTIHSSLPIDYAIQSAFFYKTINLKTKSSSLAIGNILQQLKPDSSNYEIAINAAMNEISANSNIVNQLSGKLYDITAKIITTIKDEQRISAAIETTLYSNAYENKINQKSFNELLSAIEMTLSSGRIDFYIDQVIESILNSKAYAISAYQELFKKLYTSIAKKLPSLNDGLSPTLTNTIEAILSNEAYLIDAYQESFKALYSAIAKALPNIIKDDKNKAKVARAIFDSKAYKIPAYQESFKELYRAAIEVIASIKDYDMREKAIRDAMKSEAFKDETYYESFYGLGLL